MTDFKCRLPTTPTFQQRGLVGFKLPASSLDSCEVYLVQSEKGHDDFVRSEKITHSYYVISGVGTFEVDGKRFACSPGDFIEIPPAHEFTYTGSLELILIMSPAFLEGAIEVTRPNPDVV